MEKMGNLAEKIKELRKSLGMTQSALAEKLGVHPQTITEYEAGRRRPTVSGLEALAQALGVSRADLLGDNQVKPLVVPISYFLERAASIPDDIYELAAKAGINSDAWEVVRGALEDAIELKQSKSSKRRG